MGLGNIVDQNSDTSANDTWALISGTIVVNTIISNFSGIQNIAGNYDYCVDLTMQGQEAGVGWVYTSGTDTFASPPSPPTDWVAIVQDDFDSIATAIEQVLSDYQGAGLTTQQLATAYSYSLIDGQAAFSKNQLVLMNSIYQYVLGGG